MGRTRLSNFALGSLVTLSLLICASISQIPHPGQEGQPPDQFPQGHPPPPPQEQFPQGHPPQHPQEQFPQGHPPQHPQEHYPQGHPPQHPQEHYPQHPSQNQQQFPQQQMPPQQQQYQQQMPPQQQQYQQQMPPQQQQYQQQMPPQQQQYQQQMPPQRQAPPTPFVAPTELKIEVVSRPKKCARLTKKSDLLTIHYVGRLAATNVEFDNSRKHREAFKFQLGAAAVIRGWEEGLKNMCINEVRKLIVPSHMGYGDRALERIPAKSTLLFDVELLNIEDGEKIPNVFRLIDINGDQMLSRDEVKSYIDSEAARLGMRKDADNAMLSEIFKQEDKNHDNLISHEEFSGPKHDEL